MLNDERGKWDHEKKMFIKPEITQEFNPKNVVQSITPNSPVMEEYKKVIEQQEQKKNRIEFNKDIEELRFLIKKTKSVVTRPVKYLICVGENEHVRINERLFLDEIDPKFFYIKIGPKRFKFLIMHDATDGNIFAPYFEPVYYETK